MTSSRLGPIVCALVLTFLTFCPKVAGQTTTPTLQASDPQAVTLATKALVALTGGVQVSDVTLTGTATRTAGSDVGTGTVTLKALGTVESRMDLVMSSGAWTEVRNGANGTPQGFWIDFDGTSHPMAYHNCLTEAAWFFPTLSTLNQAASTNVVTTYVGQESRNSSSVQHLRLTQSLDAASDPTGLLVSWSAEDVYLDSASLLPVAILFQTHADTDGFTDIPVEIDFSNYMPVSGRQVPFRIQKRFNGTLFLDVTIQSVTLNSGLSDTTFAVIGAGE